MTHQQREAVTFRLQARGDGDRLIDRDAEPVHTGIDMQGRAAAPIVDGDERIPLGEFGRAVDDRPQIVVGERRRRAGHEPVEHVDDGVGRERPHAPPLHHVGHEEGPAARLVQPARDRFETAAIGVGLDHGGALDRHRHARKRVPVGLDGGKVDGEDAAGFRGVAGGARSIGGPQVGIVDGHGRDLWRAGARPSSEIAAGRAAIPS